jgi:hypothetical protein
MAVKIGHASIDENGSARNGAAGDQTKKEVCTRDWYNRTGGWTTVFRAKNATAAEKIAKTMEQACANDNIGYDQNQRTTLYSKAKAVGWNLSKIAEKCECDCSSLVAVCVNAAGIAVSKDIYTGNQKAALTNTGKFEVMTAAKYLTKSDYLKRGDILLGKGHTAVVLSDGVVITENTNTNSNVIKDSPVTVTATEGARNYLKSLKGNYKVTASSLNVRNGAGTVPNEFGKNKKVIVAIQKGTKVRCEGYYTTVLGVMWYYVWFTYKGVTYTGFASSKYLAK